MTYLIIHDHHKLLHKTEKYFISKLKTTYNSLTCLHVVDSSQVFSCFFAITNLYFRLINRKFCNSRFLILQLQFSREKTSAPKQLLNETKHKFSKYKLNSLLPRSLWGHTLRVMRFNVRNIFTLIYHLFLRNLTPKKYLKWCLSNSLSIWYRYGIPIQRQSLH